LFNRDHNFAEHSFMNVPEDRSYTESHEWIRLDGESALVGLTDVDSSNSSDCTRVELLPASSSVKAGDRVGKVFFSNAERDIRAPLSGSVSEINCDLESRPQLVKRDPYGSGWLFRLEVQAGEEIEHLLDSAAYRERLLAAEAMDIEVP
jgi:glycine cleavage system H protein